MIRKATCKFSTVLIQGGHSANLCVLTKMPERVMIKYGILDWDEEIYYRIGKCESELS